LAWSIIKHQNNETKLIAYGKVGLKDISISEKFNRINAVVPFFIKVFCPTVLIIEQPIYIQNFQTSRGISYVVGYTWGRFNQEGINVIDVGPMKWKNDIGYSRVSAQEKRLWANTMEAKEVKKKAEFERKERVRRIMTKVFSIDHVDDNDIIDAIAIGYWGTKHV
jgi:Holliday junction resolvasome RuvABC endonuclease subunit